MTQDVVLWVPGRSWSCVAAPGSQTYTKKNISEKVIKVKYLLQHRFNFFLLRDFLQVLQDENYFTEEKIMMMYSFKEGKQTNGVTDKGNIIILCSTTPVEKVPELCV